MWSSSSVVPRHRRPLSRAYTWGIDQLPWKPFPLSRSLPTSAMWQPAVSRRLPKLAAPTEPSRRASSDAHRQRRTRRRIAQRTPPRPARAHVSSHVPAASGTPLLRLQHGPERPARGGRAQRCGASAEARGSRSRARERIWPLASDGQLDGPVHAAALALIVVVEEVAVQPGLHEPREPHLPTPWPDRGWRGGG